jgi:hypothetical protein
MIRFRTNSRVALFAAGLVAAAALMASAAQAQVSIGIGGCNPHQPPGGGCHGCGHAASVAGTWNSNFGKAVLQQHDNHVHGTLYYTTGGSATLNGTLANRTLHYEWSILGNRMGDGRLDLSPDGSRMAGPFTHTGQAGGYLELTRNAGGGGGGNWPPPPPPQAASIAGNWSSSFGPVVFSQSGNSVEGTLTYNTGESATLKGAMQGSSLNYEWFIGGMRMGDGTLTLSADGQRLAGPFTHTGQPGGFLDLKRAAGDQVPPPPPPTLTGKWSSTLGSVTLTQNGSKLTGLLQFTQGQSGGWIKLSGSVNGNNVSIKWEPSTLLEKPNGGNGNVVTSTVSGSGTLNLVQNGDVLTGTMQITQDTGNASSWRFENWQLNRAS